MKRLALLLLLILAGCDHTPPQTPVTTCGKVVDCPLWSVNGHGWLRLEVEHDAYRYQITVYATGETCIKLQAGRCIQDMQGRKIEVTGVVIHDKYGAASCQYINASLIQEP